MSKLALLTAVLVLHAALPPAAALAQDASQPVCLPTEAHQAILADLRELRGDGSPESGLRGRVRLLDAKLTLQDDQMRDLALAKDLAIQEATGVRKALLSAERGRRQAEESRDAWYRSPTLWFVTGLLSAVAVAIAADRLTSQ